MQQTTTSVMPPIPKRGGAADLWLELGYAAATLAAMLLAATAYALP